MEVLGLIKVHHKISHFVHFALFCKGLRVTASSIHSPEMREIIYLFILWQIYSVSFFRNSLTTQQAGHSFFPLPVTVSQQLHLSTWKVQVEEADDH